MDSKYVLVAGGGASSRANIEALLEDYIYSNKDIVFVLTWEGKPTQSMNFVSQFARDKSKDVVVFAGDNTQIDTAPSGATLVQVNSGTPFEAASDFVSQQERKAAFLLWSDEDPAMSSMAKLLDSYGVESFDLTDGLVRIAVSGGSTPAPEPVIPEAEELPEPVIYETDEEFLMSLDEDDQVEEILDEIDPNMVLGIDYLIKAIAKAVVTEMRLQAQEGTQE